MRKKGDLVVIYFLDHQQGTHKGEEDPVASHDEAWPCVAVGFLSKETKKTLTISAWISGSIDNPGTDYITLVKHSGMKIRTIKRVPK